MMRQIHFLLLGLLCVLATPLLADEGPLAEVRSYIDQQQAEGTIDKENPKWRENLPIFPEVEFPADKDYFWELQTTKGAIKIRLWPEVAPKHVANFLYLTELGFFDGLGFHRVITGFMAQGGCPQGSGRGLPGYGFDGEFEVYVAHDKPGLLSMANAGPGTDGSQFFITFKATPWLDGKHTLFGEVVEGMDAVKALEAAGSPNGKPSEPLAIETATISVAPAPADRPARTTQLDLAKDLLKQQEVDWAMAQKLASGLYVIDLAAGEGDARAAKGDKVKVHYTGWLVSGRKFDSSRDRGEPVSFPLNAVIPGWREGVTGMKPGGRRYLVIPPDLGYGPAGFRNVIPGHAWLVFDVELLEINP